MLESSLEDIFQREVRRAGGIPVKTIAVIAGTPDRYVLHSGRIYLVELKQLGETLSPVQKVWHRRALEIGVPVTVLHGSAEVRAWVSGLR